ncbi:hypothetical protein [Methylobacterium brachythecii]|uniref:Uncharacterized protein n=1 Tax=Methylobacterium brachythecii TaxID=1176177 RepID=A0A7W6AMH0_9HYPH|nr:hypothetical protein [Methylobacterium brachythecii]MBB3904494.1 hypothetical protein [Methylobacterium brachythecii]GLS45842.1 hypothetical protein GCM10007884_38330 [Methylobacterium brachythecii]
MRNLLVLLIVLGAGFVLVGMYVAPNQPQLRDWYLANACQSLDKVSPQICAPIRRADTNGSDKT